MKALVCRVLSEDLGRLSFEDVSLPPLAPDAVRLRFAPRR